MDRETRAESAHVSKGSRGPDQQPGSLRRVSERIDIPESTIRSAQKHVAAVESFPILQKPEWKQYQAMEAAEERVAERGQSSGEEYRSAPQPSLRPKSESFGISIVCALRPGIGHSAGGKAQFACFPHRAECQKF